MTKRKNLTRSALFTSILSLLLCVSMLVGTTFAWFTDEVVTGMNTIAAGNLDVELLASGANVDSTTELFDDVTLWEPGVVVYENLQIANVGTLALNYRMALNFGGENDLNGHKLSEILKVAVIDKIADGAARADVLAAAEASGNAGALSDFVLTGSLEAETSTDEQTVVIYWIPNDNVTDNLYNANNGQTTSDGQPLHIEFGVKLEATQMMHEEDSFGNDYDKDATPVELPTVKVASFEEFDAALKAMTEPTVIDATGADLIIPEEKYYIPGGATIMGGNILCSYGNGTFLVAVAGVGETVTFEGCTIKQTSYGYLNLCSDPDGADLIFNGCALYGKVQPNFTANLTGTSQFNACMFLLGEGSGPDGIGFVNCMGGTNTFNGCTYDYTNGWTMGSNQYVRYNAVNAFSESYSTAVTLSGCEFINCGTQKYGANSTLVVQ